MVSQEARGTRFVVHEAWFGAETGRLGAFPDLVQFADPSPLVVVERGALEVKPAKEHALRAVGHVIFGLERGKLRHQADAQQLKHLVFHLRI